MLGKRTLVTVIGLLLVTLGAMRSSPAQADSSDTAIIAGAAVGAYVIVVVVGTAMAFGGGPFEFTAVTAAHKEDQGSRRFRHGFRCPPREGSLALACW